MKRTRSSINKLSYKVVDSIGNLNQIRDLWHRMNWHPNTDIDFYITIFKSRHNCLRPYILVIYQSDIPTTMLIGRIEYKHIKFRIGYKTIFSLKSRCLKILYGGVIGDNENVTSRFIVKRLLRFLSTERINLITFTQLNIHSQMYKAVKEVPFFLQRSFFDTVNPHWKVLLPGQLKDFLLRVNSHHRRRLKRLRKRLEKNFNGQVEFTCLKNKRDVARICENCEEIARKTYHRGMGVGFVFNKENSRRLNLMAEKEWLQVYMLFVNGDPCAFYISTIYKDTCFLNFTGYDSRYRKYDPGTALFLYIVEDLCQNKKIRKIDFGFGDALYKRRFGDINEAEASVSIYALNTLGIMFNVTHSMTNILNTFVKYVPGHVEKLRKIKKKWREYLARKATV